MFTRCGKYDGMSELKLFFAAFPDDAHDQEEDSEGEEVDERKRKTGKSTLEGLAGRLGVVEGCYQQGCKSGDAADAEAYCKTIGERAFPVKLPLVVQEDTSPLGQNSSSLRRL